MHIPLTEISRLLDRHRVTDVTGGGRVRASVAMILAERDSCTEMLFIERARDERDPWSGNLAFPGGRVEPGEEPCEAAMRETREEIGLDLEAARPVGRLADIVGTNLPVQVSCFAYGLSAPPGGMALNHEVREAFWVRLSDLLDVNRHIVSEVRFGERLLAAPAIRLPGREAPVLWGITYRLVMQFLALLPEPTRPGIIFPPDTAHAPSLCRGETP